MPIASAFDPDLVLVSAGFDAAGGERERERKRGERRGGRGEGG